MFAIIPAIILAGGLSVGAFDNTDVLDVTDTIEISTSTHEVASLDFNE